DIHDRAARGQGRGPLASDPAFATPRPTEDADQRPAHPTIERAATVAARTAANVSSTSAPNPSPSRRRRSRTMTAPAATAIAPPPTSPKAIDQLAATAA